MGTTLPSSPSHSALTPVFPHTPLFPWQAAVYGRAVASKEEISSSNNQTASLSSTVGPVSVPPTPRVSSPSSKRNETKLRAQSLLCCYGWQKGEVHGDQRKEERERNTSLFFYFPHARLSLAVLRGWGGVVGRRKGKKWNPCFFNNTFRVMCMMMGSGLGEWRQFSKR